MYNEMDNDPDAGLDMGIDARSRFNHFVFCVSIRLFAFATRKASTAMAYWCKLQEPVEVCTNNT